MSKSRWGMHCLCALLVAAGCSSDSTPKPDGKVKIDGGAVPEDTAERCQDQKDNDGDGHTDCVDQNCWSFAFCADAGPGDAGVDQAVADGADHDGPIPDRAVVDGPAHDSTAPDGPKADGPKADGPKADGPKADGPALDARPPDAAVHDTVAHDTVAHDTVAHDTVAHDTTSCGNNYCEKGESCDGVATADGGVATIACPNDCPSLKTGASSGRYCCVEGVCVGPGCSAAPAPDCKPEP